MKYRDIFFDLDGTLIDSATGITNSVMHALGKRGIKVTDRRSLYRFIGPPLVDSFTQFYSFSHEEALKAVADYREYYSVKGIYENELIADCKETLSALKEQGCHLYVCTSKPDGFTVTILRYFGIDGFFDGVFAASMDESLCRKEDILRAALASVGSGTGTVAGAGSGAVMVGDRHYDIDGARANSIDSIGVLCGFGSEKELSEAGATHIVKGLREVAGLILNQTEQI